jgi:hypothetical protein
MAIFNSYVKLPEGNCHCFPHLQTDPSLEGLEIITQSMLNSPKIASPSHLGGRQRNGTRTISRIGCEKNKKDKRIAIVKRCAFELSWKKVPSLKICPMAIGHVFIFLEAKWSRTQRQRGYNLAGGSIKYIFRHRHLTCWGSMFCKDVFTLR